MTEIMPFPENNYETVLLDRPVRVASFKFSWLIEEIQKNSNLF